MIKNFKGTRLLYGLGVLTIALIVAFLLLPTRPQFAASPPSGTISLSSPTVSWSRDFLVSNPATCFSVSGIDPTCDRFLLTIVPPPPGQNFVVTVRASAANALDSIPPTDDIDLYVRDPSNQTIASSGTPGGVEELVLRNPPAGTYTVVVEPFLVYPAPTGGHYSGVAELALDRSDSSSNSYHGTRYTDSFVGVPENRSGSSAPLVSELKTSFNYVGRQAAEPTVGINTRNVAFYAASTFDFPTPDAPARLARTVVMRSRDKGVTWQPVNQFRLAPDNVEMDSSPTSLDPKPAT